MLHRRILATRIEYRDDIRSMFYKLISVRLDLFSHLLAL